MKGKVLIGPSSFAALDRSPIEKLVEGGFDIIENTYGRKLTKQELIKLLPGVSGLIAGLETLDEEVMRKTELKVISRCGSGISNVDIKSAEKLGIKVYCTPYGPTRIVVPVYNEEHIVEELITRLQKITDPFPYKFEFIIVDDGSQDGTLNMLLSLKQCEPRLKIIKLSRNWGHQNAYNAGLDHSGGNAVILMDGDLEDPPELIPELVKKWEEGFDVIYTIKESRQESILKKSLFAFFYFLMRQVSDISIDRQAGMFSLIDEKAVDELKKCNEENKYYVGLRHFVGFKQTSISYHREKRFSGTPKQTFKRLFNYALNAFFSFSFFPIRLLTISGFLIVTAIAIFSVILIFLKLGRFDFWMTRDLPGWTSIVLVMFFILGVQIIFMGILGEYVARIFDEVRNRPYYIVEKIYAADDE